MSFRRYVFGAIKTLIGMTGVGKTVSAQYITSLLEFDEKVKGQKGGGGKRHKWSVFVS